jgi:CubicO group peptidase (beta-lactamase class C family)
LTTATALPEASPQKLGLDPDKLEAVFARAKRDVDDGILPSCQVAVARHGLLAGFRTYGQAVQGGELKPATNDTLYHVFSCTKAVVAAATWLLIERKQLRIEEKVTDIIPEFGTNGKDVVTIEQLFLHTAGFPYAPFPESEEAWNGGPASLQAFADWKLTYEPGSRYEYHATSVHWVLAEIIKRRDGRDWRQFIREEITGPMGLDEIHVGLPDELHGRVAEVGYAAEPIEPPGGWGVVTPEAILRINEPRARRLSLPGGGAISNAAQMALFYQVLLNGGRTLEGQQILKPETIDYATAVRSQGYTDPFLDFPILRGLSIIIAGDDGFSNYRGFGKTVSGRAFGHGGAGGQIAWGDPETGISLAYMTNGFLDFMLEGRRITAISSLAGSCLA